MLVHPKTQVLILFVFATSLSLAFAAQTISDRVEIDDDDISADIAADDLFGYYVESIGDLDNSGTIDLAVIKFSDDSGEANAGSIEILFMNNDGSVASTAEITHTDTAGTGLRGGAQGAGACIVGDSTNRQDTSLEQLAFVGDLDGDGKPTLALGAPDNDHGVSGSGAIYMLELNTDGTVDNCLRIIPTENGFAPGNGVYLEGGDAALGWPLIATDVDGDGQNELIAGASNEADNATNLWVLFLSGTGAVSSHPATPILAVADLGASAYTDDGDTVNGGTKIVMGAQADGAGEGSIFVINLSAAGAYSSSTEITGISLGVGIDATDSFGSGVSALPDMDNDGVKDILVGNEVGDDTLPNTGEVYILYMNSDDSVKETQKISDSTELTRTGSSFLAQTDLFGHGMDVWRSSSNTVYIAISAHGDDTGGATAGAVHIFTIAKTVTATSDNDGGGGSDDRHKTKPTFGLDHNTFAQLVDEGLIINGESFTVIDNYWTPIPMQNLTIGVVQNFTATTYAQHPLHIMEFLFGIPEVGYWGDAESSVAIELDYQGKIIGVDTKNVDDVIADFSVLNYSSTKIKCTEDSPTQGCNRVSVMFAFNEAPVGKVLALQAIDYKFRNTILYFNDGLEIQGESLNPPREKQIQSEIKYNGMQTVQRVDKVNDLWITLDENEPIALYKQNSFGTFIPMERRDFEPIHDIVSNIMERHHSEFSRFVQLEQERAQIVMDILYPGIHD